MSNFNRGDEVLGFRILKEQGEGGMSKVYLAERKNNKTNDNPYAIVKVLNKSVPSSSQTKELNDINSQWQKAIDEFKITWSLFQNPHENIVKPIQWDFSSDSMVIIISEYIDGPVLNKFLEENKALTIDRAMFYFKKICNGVRHFHKLDDKIVVIHRDLKPENIILTKDLREIKIIDYGIATSFYDNSFNSSEETIYCTADYTTPDVLQLTPTIVKSAHQGDRENINKMKKIIGPQFDFHALGVILYLMITGVLPFKYNKQKIKDVDIIKMWLNYDLPIISNSISNVPNSIENIIFKCTASKPEDLKFRYKDIDELIHDLDTWNNAERIDEPLLKPIEKRVFQQHPSFDVKREKKNEKFYESWWFYWVITSISIVVIIIMIVVLVLYYTKGEIFA